MTIGYVLESSRIVRESFIRDEITALQRKGHRIVLVPLLPPSDYEKTEVQDRLVELDALPEPLAFSMTLKGMIFFGITHPATYLRAFGAVRRYVGWRLMVWAFWAAGQLKHRGVNRLHAHFLGTASIRTMALARILDIPFSCTGHGSDVLLKRHDFLPEVVDASSPLITISQYNKQQLTTAYRLDDKRIEVVHCGVDLDKFRPVSRPAPACPSVLSVTWLIEVKGVDYLFEACRMLKEKGCRFTCTVVGGGRDEQDYNNAQSEIERLEITDVVTLVRRVSHDEVKAYMQRMDIFVLPSLSEGISVALMEAMAMEMPVVATRITGIPELVDHEINGLLVEPADAGALAAQMERLIDDGDLRVRLGKAAREKIVREFSLDVVTDSLEQAWIQHTVP